VVLPYKQLKLNKNVDKSVDMGIKDKSLIQTNLKGLFAFRLPNTAINITLLKTDSPFCVCLLDFIN
jgi:hypothetical protein